MFMSRLVAFGEDTHINGDISNYKINKKMQKRVENHMRCDNCGNLNGLGSYDLRKATSRPIERNRDYFNSFYLLKVGKLYKLKLKRKDIVQAQ